MAKLLIVDDEPAKRALLYDHLGGGGHELVEADAGERALAIARRWRPDLVLLDARMPGLSAFDATRFLKELATHELLPVILLAAPGDHEARAAGLRAGADDLVTWPIARDELTVRVDKLLALREKEAALQRRLVELVELQRFREELSALIVSDLRSPLTSMLAKVDFLLGDETAGPDALDALRDTRSTGERALRLLGNLVDVARGEAGQLQLRRRRFPLGELMGPVVRRRAALAAARGITLDSALDPAAELDADRELLGRVVENVLDNALRHTPPGGRISIRGARADGRDAVRISIGNSGAAIGPAARARIFEKFAQSGDGAGRMNLGLGLYFCRLATEAHGGRIWVDESPELPTVFSLELPA